MTGIRNWLLTLGLVMLAAVFTAPASDAAAQTTQIVAAHHLLDGSADTLARALASPETAIKVCIKGAICPHQTEHLCSSCALDHAAFSAPDGRVLEQANLRASVLATRDISELIHKPPRI